MNTIKLKLAGQCWVAISDEHIPVFGTDTIPTAFTNNADPDYVRARIQELNPDCRVIVVASVNVQERNSQNIGRVSKSN